MQNSLSNTLLEFKNKNNNLDIKSTDFLIIQKSIQTSNYNQLGIAANEWLEKGYYDFRLLIYFLHSHLLKSNQLGEALKNISLILNQQYEIIRPQLHKNKQISQALIWFHKRLLVIFDDKDFKQNLDNLDNLSLELLNYKKVIKNKCEINYCEYLNTLENKTFLIINENKNELDFNDQNLTQNQEQNGKEIFKEHLNQNLLNNSISNNKTNRAFYSSKLEKLLSKINIFKLLLENNNYQKAADVEFIIDKELDLYQAYYYFEELFTEYFTLKFKYLDVLQEYQNIRELNPEAKEIKILEKVLNLNAEVLI